MFKIKVNNVHIFQANCLAPKHKYKFVIKNKINISDDCGVLKMREIFEIVYLGNINNLVEYENYNFPYDEIVTRNSWDKINSKFSEDEINRLTNFVTPKDCLKDIYDQLKHDYSNE